MEHVEVLDIEPQDEEPPVGRTPPRRVLTVAVAVLAVVLAGGFWWFDQAGRDGETTALTACVNRAEQAGRYAENKVTSMRTYITPVLGSDASASVRSGLFDLVREQAAQGLPGLEKAQQTCQAVDVRGRHGDIAAARRDYLTYLAARTDVLRTISADGGRSITGDAGVPALRDQALKSLKAAGITP